MGIDAVALNTGTVASGDSSLAVGIGSLASGEASFAQGTCSVASAADAVAEGNYTSASGIAAHAEGSSNTSSGLTSHVEGYVSVASDTAAHAEGYHTRAAAYAAHAEGNTTLASGQSSHAEGVGTTASGSSSHAEGSSSIASNYYAHAEGAVTVASGMYSHAQNYNTIAQNQAQTAIGKCNIESNPDLNNTPGDDAFIIGNGLSPIVRSNAFRIQFDGDVHSASGVYTTGADYAEMFEWQDKNPTNEDRIGYFVTVQRGYIRKANDTDKYILGVVSSAPSIVGDSQGCGWQGMYLKDKWGRTLYEWADVQQEILEAPEQPEGLADAPVVRKEAIEPSKLQRKSEMIRVYRPRLNPAYNSSLRYQPRTERGEWAAVGMMGKLRVRDDGSCQPDGLCKPNRDGIATASNEGYLVLKRIDTDIVLICLKG